MKVLETKIPFEDGVLAFTSWDIALEFKKRFSRKGMIFTSKGEITVDGFEDSEIQELEIIVQDLISTPELRVETVKEPQRLSGKGSPEGVLFGSIGDSYSRLDENLESNIYIKTKGDNTNIGWVPK